MLIAKAKRTDLLHLGVREWEAQRADTVPVPEDENCVLVWYDKLNRLPDIIVLEDDGIQSFLAWTTTYAPHLTPITALVEVEEYQTFQRLHAADRVCDAAGPRPDEALTRGFLGLIHAEVAAGFQGASAPLSVGVTPHTSTFSWLAFQWEPMSSISAPLRILRENWDEARKLFDADSLGYHSPNVEEVWALLTDSDFGDNSTQGRETRQIAAFLESVRSGKPAWDALDVAQEHSSVLSGLQKGPLERRVEVFRKLVRSLYAKQEPPSGHAVVLGFALSLISQGSFSHVGLLAPSRVSDVRPLLWYGWFDFYRHTPEAASPACAGASLQLLRSVHSFHSSGRRPDIAIDELRVLSRQKLPFSECLLDRRHPVRVEIVNGASTLIQPGALRGRNQQGSRFNENS